MLRATYAMIMLLPALVVGYAACSPQDASEENDGVAEAEISSAPRLLGTFRAEQMHYGITVLTLKKDWTFHMEKGLECVRAPCPYPQMNGYFSLTSSNGVNVMVLYTARSDTSTPPLYLRYQLRGDALYVATLDRTSLYQVLWRTDATAWCSARTDCYLQDLPEGPCAGNWVCSSNVCSYACGPATCETEDSCPIM